MDGPLWKAGLTVYTSDLARISLKDLSFQDFRKAFLARFSVDNQVLARMTLHSLRQEGDMSGYIAKFEALAASVKDLNAEEKLVAFSDL